MKKFKNSLVTFFCISFTAIGTCLIADIGWGTDMLTSKMFWICYAIVTPICSYLCRNIE